MNDQRDGRNIANGIEGKVALQRCHAGMGADDDRQRIAIGCGAHQFLGRDHPTGTGAIFNHQGLAEMFRNALLKDARHDIRRTAWREAQQ